MNPTLTRPSNLQRKKRIGRGGDRGKTSGKGHKGQKSRAGRKIRPHIRDEIQRIPKRRGYSKKRSRTVWVERPKAQTLTLKRFVSFCDTVDCSKPITPKTLIDAGICKKEKGKIPRVKIIGFADSVPKKIILKKIIATPKAKEAIVGAGGSVS